eukprot:CAMPEP_0198243208 /NCGR_PEP_ID=MMETSP1446-20131203/25558_1 /TAXON_ID=1461542 ORGANISM="Unidentified sp, Strain CCMP2111" /NCGR_SAMPLE_ID=MMETSP1446 /ASSEMBLY_ACC=CAM_ASM_001112 /LENGTH=72 /DNA_ID=CAMNT_0043926965 /DNA_START=271 /DNA_END=485 /DNA_ORIENTATION=-
MAVTLDVDDGYSWYILGNAHLFLAFSGSNQGSSGNANANAHVNTDKLIRNSLKAYTHSIKVSASAKNNRKNG